MITTFDQLYLEIAKIAKASGNEQMFKAALKSRASQSRAQIKEMERRNHHRNDAQEKQLTS